MVVNIEIAADLNPGEGHQLVPESCVSRHLIHFQVLLIKTSLLDFVLVIVTEDSLCVGDCEGL